MKGHYSFSICLLVIGIVVVHSASERLDDNVHGTKQPYHEQLDIVDSHRLNSETNNDGQYANSMTDGVRRKREDPRNRKVMDEKNIRNGQAQQNTLQANAAVANARNEATRAYANFPQPQRNQAINRHTENAQRATYEAYDVQQVRRQRQRDRE